MYPTTPYEKVFIFELTTLIADGLTQHDLALCCRVNKSFFATFTPHLWHSITILRNDLIPKFQTPEARAGLLRNGHHIRVLRSQSVELLEPFLESGITCTNLVSLDTQIKFYAPLWRSRSTEGSQSWDPRSSAMRSKGRRGSSGTGQQQRPVPGFGYTEPAPTSSAFGASTPSALGFGYATPFPASSDLFGSPCFFTPTGPFGGATGHRPKAVTEKSEIESILAAILERNPRLEYVIVPSNCLESETVVKLAGESLPLLKEFYSLDSLWMRDRADEFYLSDKPYSGGQAFSTELKGYLLRPGGAHSLSLLKNYPRLREFRSDSATRINYEALETIRKADKELTFLQIHCMDAASLTCRQILMAASGLTSIDIIQYGRCEDIPFEDRDRSSFLKHAPTLEHLDVSSCDFDDDTVLALLRACPSLKTLVATGEPHGYRPRMEAELDALVASTSPWMCDLLEIFDCKITRVPRPDIVVTEIGDDLGGWVLDLPSQVSSHVIVLQESHHLQRKILKQLGRLTHLRTLSLETRGHNDDDPIYSQLEIKGIRTMVVEGSFQTDCLELTLESGLDELAGLKELETFSAYQMAHRIGVAEVRWMVENWPKLKSLSGLRYENCNHEIERNDEDEESDGGDDDDNNREDEEPEALVWIRENRPDITAS